MDNYKDMSIVVGIDLGTTNSCVSYYSNGKLTIMKHEGQNTIPSQLYFNNSEILFGNEIKKVDNINPKNLITELKRIIGRNYQEEFIKEINTFLSYDLENNNNVIYVKTPLGSKSPENLTTLFLSKLKLFIMEYLGTTKKIKTVVTIPAYYNDKQKQLTKYAIENAGFELIRLVSEPTAAALYYGIDSSSDKNIFVFDFGGGTLDVSILNVEDGFFEVMATDGDSYLGGQNFTDCLYDFCIKEFKKVNDLEAQKISLHKKKLFELKKKCEKSKINLSEYTETTIEIKNFWGTIDLNIHMTRDLFNLICIELFEKSLIPVKRIFHQNKIDVNSITDILLVGGSSKLPVIKSNLKNFFKKDIKCVDNLDTIVSSGASIYGYILENKITSLSKEITLIDVLPLSLGVGTSDGLFSPIIKRNTPIPVKKSARYTTDKDFETSIKIEIYEGERQFTKDNFLIGEFILSGIKKQKKGLSLIEVTFSIDCNGLLQIYAKDIKGDSESSLIVERKSTKMNDDNINDIIQEAESKLLNDIENKSILTKKNELTNIYWILVNTIKNDNIQMSNDDKQIIIDELTDIYSKYNDMNANELLLLINNLKKKYGSLLLIDQNTIKINDETTDTNYYFNETENNVDDVNIIKQRIIEKCKIYQQQLDDNDDLLEQYLVNLIFLLKNDDFESDLLIAKEIEMTNFVTDYFKNKFSSRYETKKLCLSLQEQINSNELNETLNTVQINELEQYISNILHEIETTENTNEYWNNKIDLINEYCEKLVNE